MINPRPAVELTREGNSAIIISIHPRSRSGMTSLKRYAKKMAPPPTMNVINHTLYTVLFAVRAFPLMAEEPHQKTQPPVRLEVSVDKEVYALRGAIALTITYTNTSKRAITLGAGGAPAGEGFPGETFEVTTKAGRKTYSIFAVDPLPLAVKLEPGKSWKRTIKDLASLLSNSDVAIDGKLPQAKDPMPDPFGLPGKYAVRILFESTLKNEPNVFGGKFESNTAKFDVGLR